MAQGMGLQTFPYTAPSATLLKVANMQKWKWTLNRYSRRLWVRASFFSLLGVATALCAAWFKDWIPPGWGDHIGAQAVDDILKIIASSMLAVTTFSLGIVVSAYSSASNSATPRATPLLTSDTTAHNALSTFIGAFLFSIVGIVALKTGVYEQQGRVLLFMMTVLVIVLIVYTLLRWIHHLSQLGRLGSTVDKLEEVACRSLRQHLQEPFLGGREWATEHEQPAGTQALTAPQCGYVQAVDMAVIAQAMQAHHLEAVYLCARPGRLVDPNVPLLYFRPSPEAAADETDAEASRQALETALCAAFSIGTSRSFDFDPRFGMIVMSEVASKALSSAINDSGTVIDLIGRAVRVFRIWVDYPAKKAELRYEHIWVPPLPLSDYFDDFFPVVSRDGAGLAEVGVRLQKALLALARTGDPEMIRLAQRHAQHALQHAEKALPFDFELEPIRAIHAQIQQMAASSTR